MVLAKQDLRRLILSSPPLFESYLDLDQQLQPNGFDLTLRDVAVLTCAGSLGEGKSRTISETVRVPFDGTGYVTLAPGSYLVTYNEVVNMPADLTALGRPRSSLVRCGVTLGTAVWDAGYSGRSQSLLVVHNTAGFRLQKNARLMQLVFFRLSGPAESAYSGAFQRENT